MRYIESNPIEFLNWNLSLCVFLYCIEQVNLHAFEMYDIDVLKCILHLSKRLVLV